MRNLLHTQVSSPFLQIEVEESLAGESDVIMDQPFGKSNFCPLFKDQVVNYIFWQFLNLFSPEEIEGLLQFFLIRPFVDKLHQGSHQFFS